MSSRAHLDLPSQASYFYGNSVWTEELDKKFLDLIHGYIGHPSDPQGWHLYDAATLAGYDLGHNENLPLEQEEIDTRIRALKARYEAFTLVVCDKGLCWDTTQKVVRGPDSVWRRLFEKNALVKAYYKAAEPHYALLCIVFGTEWKKEEGPVSEEVNSPTLSSKRRLFDDTDSCSIVAPPANFRSKANSTKKPIKNKGAINSTSSSPLMWWKP